MSRKSCKSQLASYSERHSTCTFLGPGLKSSTAKLRLKLETLNWTRNMIISTITRYEEEIESRYA